MPMAFAQGSPSLQADLVGTSVIDLADAEKDRVIRAYAQFENFHVDNEGRGSYTIEIFSETTKYSVNYEVEEPRPIFEHIFLINSQKFSLSFTYPSEEKIDTMKLYHISSQDREKNLVTPEPNPKRGLFTQLMWKIENGIKEKDIIRLEW